MDPKTLITEIEELLEVDEGTLSPETELESIPSWDSLAVIGYIALVDREFSIIVDNEKLTSAKTIQDLLDLACGPARAQVA